MFNKRVFAAAFVACLLSFTLWTVGTAHPADAEHEEPIQYSSLAGTWYPADRKALEQELDAFLSAYPAHPLQGRLICLIVPHAGYRYCGRVAGQAYRQLKGRKFDTVVVIGPSHRVAFPGVSVYRGKGYETPLGAVRIDRELSDRIRSAHKDITFFPQAHAGEHSVEIELPFLQRVLGDFRLVSVIAGRQDYATCRILADAVYRAVHGLSKEVLIVASSDLSHFHPYDEAGIKDRSLARLIEGGEPAAVSRALESGECEACGGGPIVSAMLYAQQVSPRHKVTILKYENSGDVTGERARVVGYLAAAVTVDAETPPSSTETDPGLTADEKDRLRTLAKDSVRRAVEGRPVPRLESPSAHLKTPCGAFVTLKKHGELRGCIGFIRAEKPLWQTVAETAREAALHDPRFPPLTAGELSGLDLEISVLSTLRRVTDPAEIRVGRDGIFIVGGGRSGLLLPQVASEFGWDRQTFLEQTCRKAGLPRDAWRDKDVVLYAFTAQVF